MRNPLRIVAPLSSASLFHATLSLVTLFCSIDWQVEIHSNLFFFFDQVVSFLRSLERRRHWRTLSCDGEQHAQTIWGVCIESHLGSVFWCSVFVLSHHFGSDLVRKLQAWIGGISFRRCWWSCPFLKASTSQPHMLQSVRLGLYIAQPAHDVRTTLYGRRFNVHTTSFQRRSDVVCRLGGGLLVEFVHSDFSKWLPLSSKCLCGKAGSAGDIGCIWNHTPKVDKGIYVLDWFIINRYFALNGWYDLSLCCWFAFLILIFHSSLLESSHI